MFINKNKNRIYGVKSETTYVDNPPIEDITKKTIKSYNISYVFKFLFTAVLIVFLMSFSLNGYLDSRITANSTEDTIVHEYKKQIGTELVGGNFDDFTYDNFGELTFNKKIYFKKQVPSGSEIISISSSSSSITGSYGLRFVASNFKLYDDNDNLLYSYNYNTEFTLKYNFRIRAYSTELDYLYFSIYSLSGVQVSVYICDIIGNQVANNPNYNIKYPSAHYFTYSSYYNSSSNIAFQSTGASRISFSENLFNIILNDNLIYDDFSIVPIYETTTYDYSIKDINYNWDYKLQQLTKLRNIFEISDFVNEDNSIRGYIAYYNTFKRKLYGGFVDETLYNNWLDEIETKYKQDLKIKTLIDNGIISIHFRNYNEFLTTDVNIISYLKVDNFSLVNTAELLTYYNYALSNYLFESKLELYKNVVFENEYLTIDEILKMPMYPFKWIYNLFYDLGVIISFVTQW